MEVDWQTILEFLKVLLSWPPITVCILGIIIWNFKISIQKWLEKLKIEYGGVTVSPSQASVGEKEIILPGSQPQISSEAEPLKPQSTSEVSYESILEGKSIEDLKNFVMQWRANAYLWEYKFLNSYLVPHTQMFLDWLYEEDKPVPVEYADNYWKAIIPLPSERFAVVSALADHSLLQLIDNCLVITPKGKEYVEIMGKSITNALKKALEEKSKGDRVVKN